ncbi:PREDICTED: uncharacterized protein LOC105560330 [Vollenhovia emeryi]|uniref:uncharacterized protein LOC105560330 n=1 Tax=Vollenhovia emeryi TaxID=411798 RepID=UPI0005F4F2CC|nr:PREDICTED: uncharacterized protein LOC105560330 [Vollenhovia emeryi]
MTIHKKGTVSKMKNAGAVKNEVATTSTSSDVATAETVEVVSATSVVEESNQVKESESRSSTVEVTSASREVIMDSRGNVIKVIETPPQTVQRSSSSRKTGKSSQDFIAGEQVQSIKQAKTTRETPREHATSLSESRTIQGGTTERASQSVQMQSQSASMAEQSSSSSILVESSSTCEDHSGHRSTVAVSHDSKNGAHVPVIQTSLRSTESTHVSSETSEAVTKDGQTKSSTTRIRETGGRIDDNGRTMSTSSREVDSERTITPSNVVVIKNTDDINRTGDKSTRRDSKAEHSNIEISTRCNKPGQSTWDGTFVYEKPVASKGKRIHGDARDSETSVKVTQEASSAEVIDQIVSSSSSVTRDSKTIVDGGQRSATRLRDITLEKAATDATDFAGEKYPKGPVRHSKPGDSDGIYEKESSETVRVVKGAADSTRFISEEQRDVRRESTIHVDGTSSSKEEHPARVSSPSQRRLGRLGDSAWNGEFIYEKSQDDVKKHPSDVTVVRRTEKHHDSVDVEDVSEEQNVSSVSESVSASYIVEYAISSDKTNVEKVTSVSEAILEEDGPEDKIARSPRSPERQPKLDTTSRCYKPGQSAWDGTFVHERPVAPDSGRRPNRRTVKTVDIRDVSDDNSINEADIINTTYIVEHSSSQQSFSDVRDASVTSTMYETVVREGQPVETTIRFDGDTSRSKVPTTGRRTSPSPRPTSPEKTPNDRDLRSTKPGSSTWDGTFVQEKKRPPSRESIDSRLPDKPRPADSKKTTLVDTSKKHVNETAIDLRDVTRDVSSTSEIVESSVVVEQSRTHESYTDSSSLDFSTASVETVIIRDGQPVTTQKTVTIQEGPRSPVKSLPGSDVITTTDVKETTVKSLEKKESRADDRSYRPLKPGSSTWDGSFVYEKPEEKRPSDRKPPKVIFGTVDKPSPIKEKPTGTVDHRTVTILDTSKDVTSAADFSTSSVTIERTTDSETRDSSNISKIFIKESAGGKVCEIDYEKPSQLFDGKPTPSPRQRPEDVKEPKREKPQKGPVDRTHRPSKPGSSTWDGSFVYEKPEEKRPGDRKMPKDTSGTVDKPSPIKEKPIDIADHKTSITILNTSKDISSSADYATSSVTVEQTYVADSKIRDSSNISKIFIKDSSGDKVYPIDYERPRQFSDERPKPSPRQRPEDTVEPKDEKPQKSPVDRTHRPSKPGASTWDGSFVYEKPQDSRKKPTDDEPTKVPKKPADQRKPIEEGHRPVVQKEKPIQTPISRKPTDKGTQRDVTEIKYVEDVADITRADITRTSEMLQQSSYVSDQSSRFTSVQDVHDVKDERVITEFTTDTRKDVRDVTESTKKFIDKEQVTSMVARDVVDDTRFDTITSPASRSPADSTRKPSPERPGYPRGIPGLRKDDRTKPIPAAGKPSRPLQRERSPQQPAEHGRPSEVRPKSPEKSRDYTSPTRKPQPAAGKPSRPEERPTAPRKPDKESGPTKPTEKRPAAEPKSSRFPEKFEKPKRSEQDKPKRGGQSPDSLEEDVVYPRSEPDILSKIPLKEQCICELCTCGRHRCPHNFPQEHLEFSHGESVHAVTSYRQDYDEKRVEKQMKYHHEDQLRTEGEFIGQRRTDYVATKGERAPVRKPQDHLKPEGEFVKRPKEEAPTRGERAPVKKPQDNLRPEGEFIGKPREEAPKYGERAPITKPRDNLKFEGDFDTTTTTELVFIGTPGERPVPIRRNTYTKLEGDFTDETTTRSQYIDHRSIQRAEIIKRTDNLTVGEGEFTGTSHIKEDFQTHVIEREPQWRPKYPEDTDRFYSKTDITDSTTTTQEQFRTFDQADYKSTTVIRRADNLRPEGPFEASPHTKDDYIIPKLLPRPEPQKPKDNLKPEGPFEGRPKDDYSPKRGERYEVKRPEDNLRPEGPFEGRPKDDYKPKRGERPEVKRPEDNLRPEGQFEGRPRDDYRPTRGERADVKRPQDNLKPEGPFQGRPKDDFTPKTAERPEVKRPKDNLRPEGDFADRPKGQYTPGEKRSPIRHPDNLHPEGDFERPVPIPYGPGDRASIVRHPDNLFPIGEFPDREVEPFRPAERRTPIKHDDNLRPEGDFTGRPKDDYRPTKGERADVKRPEDNLRPGGPFQGRPKDDYSPKRAERPEVKRPEDNLRPEGDFERPEKAPIGPAERRTPIKHADNLRPEGEFVRPRHDGYRPAEKPEVKKPVDNLRPEGEFERPRPGKYAPAEKRTPVKHPDNLKPEGEFIGKPKDDFTPTKGIRADVKRPEDNLRPEGPFEGRPKDDYRPVRGERMDVVKRTDNLRMEGDIQTYRSRDEYTDFLIRERAEITKYEDNLRMEDEFIDVRTRDDFKVVKGERMDVVKHRDNLRPEGPFEGRPKDDYSPKKAERPEIKKPEDNLRPEGDFVRWPKEEAPKTGERAHVKKPRDNLRPEGDFERPEKKPIGPAERRTPIKHSDNGDFERPEKKPIGPAERRTPIKHADNLKPEGEFARKPKEEAPRRGDRADVKRPTDNLKPEGEFERPEKAPIRPAEKRVPIKHPDNLRPEGEFEKRPKEKTPIKGERADVTRPKDNLRPEGEFERPQKSPIGPAERRTPIRHEDNLHPEGEFVGRPKDDFIPKRADRPIQKKPKDNLKPEGEFVGRPKDDYKPTKGERTEIVVHRDNLKMEGDIDVYRSRDDYVTTSKRERVDIVHHEDNLKIEGEFVDIRRRDDYRATRGERSDIIRREDNLYPEGDFERPEKAPVGPAERRSPIKHPDNLKPEGDFVQRPKETAPIKGDRAVVKKPKDNLKPEGEFERPAKSPIGPGERRSPIKHPDNLHPEGEFIGRPKKDTPLKGDRADVKKPKDNLHPEGEFAKRSPKKVGPAERRTPIKHEDNLHPEGDFYMVPKDDFTPKRGDRSPVKKPQDNLRPEGKMEVSPKDDYKYVNGERVDVRRHEDHLRMEGQMDIHRSRDDYKKITRVEKVDVKRHEDNLRMEGEFIDVRRKDDYVHVVGERVPIKRHPDNLRPEGDFDRPQKTVIGLAEKRSPIKHPDNLKPEGDFQRRTPEKIGPGERRSPIRHADNLKPEGDFIGRPRDDFTPKRAERAEVVKREDNLKMTGGFEGTTSHKSTYTVVRGERADIKSHEDNLKISTGTMETKTTSRDTYTPSKYEPSPAGKPVNRRRHMESSISLGDDTTMMTTTNQRNYNTYTRRTGKDVAAKMSQMESDTRKTMESQTLADGAVVTTVRRTTASAQSDQRAAQSVAHHQQTQYVTDRRAAQPNDVSPSGLQPVDSRRTTSQLVSNQHHEQRTHLNEQHFRSQNMQSRRTIEDRSFTEGLNRGQIVRGEDTSRYAIDATHGDLHRQQQQQQQQHYAHHQEMTKRDYVNAQHMESRQRSATKQHEQHTLSSQARYNSNSPEFRQSINGQNVERSQVDSATKFGHHRKNVISSSSADVNNAVLHRRGAASSTEALHTISSTAADQRKSISNLAESGQYISNSTQSNDRRSFTSLHRTSKEVNPWASSSYERPQRIVRQDNLTVGGKFYSQSEAKNYGNFSQSTQKVERVQRQSNASHINLGDGSTVSSSMYKREYVPRHGGPCPAALLEAKQAPFKHTRDTQKHKFYMPVVSN